eukprot:2211001-Pleurochrysis_carterae.AAC.1
MEGKGESGLARSRLGTRRRCHLCQVQVPQQRLRVGAKAVSGSRDQSSWRRVSDVGERRNGLAEEGSSVGKRKVPPASKSCVVLRVA